MKAQVAKRPREHALNLGYATGDPQQVALRIDMRKGLAAAVGQRDPRMPV
jgi:hypothetical protein